MAKKAATVKAAIEALFQATFQHEKDTKNKVRFAEDVEAGKPEIVGSLYMVKSFMPEASRVTLTATAGDEDAVTDLEARTVVFKYNKDTKNKFRYEEIVEAGQAGVIDTLYVAKTAFSEQPPDILVVQIEG